MKIPRRQSDILLKTYFKYQDFLTNIKPEEKEDYFLLMKNTIMIFYDIDEQKYDSIPYTQILDMYKIIENITSTPQNLVPIIKIKGKKYGINPSFADMTLAELVDCDTTDIIKQMAILYRPITKKLFRKYRVDKYKANIEHYEFMKENLTLDVYNGFITFFLKIQKSFMIFTLKSLKAMDINPEMKNTLEENGAGLLGFMNSAQEILQSKIASLK